MIRCNICGDIFAIGKALKLHKHIHDNQSVKEIANDLKWLDSKNKIFKEVILEPKAKCEYGNCEHSHKVSKHLLMILMHLMIV